MMPDSAAASAIAPQWSYISETEVVPKRRHSAMDSRVAAFTARSSNFASRGKI